MSKRMPARARTLMKIDAAILLFLAAAFLASRPGVSGIERAIFDFIYAWPDALRPLFLAVTQLGGVGILFATAFAYLIRRHYQIVVQLLLTGGLAFFLTYIAKEILGRPRPGELLAEVFYRDDLVQGMGFPSGHTAIITAIGMVAARRLKRKQRWAVWIVIGLVAISRVYLGVHMPLDIVGGFAIGWFSAELFRLVKILPVASEK